MICANCEKNLQEKTEFCPHCGKELVEKPDVDVSDMENNLEIRNTPQKSGNSALKAFGIISILAGPLIALYIGYNEYTQAHRAYSFFWGARGAGRAAENALMNAMPLILLVAGAGILFGIILLIAGRKK